MSCKGTTLVSDRIPQIDKSLTELFLIPRPDLALMPITRMKANAIPETTDEIQADVLVS